jgi:uncharacterized protein
MTKRKMEFSIYRDNASEWRWRLYAANGKIMADSAEGYKNRKDCFNSLNSILDTVFDSNYRIDNN